MFDPNRFVELIKGGLLEADANAGAYRAENRNWQYTAFTLAGPLIVLSMIAAGLIAWLLNSGPQFGGFGWWLASTLASLAQFALAVLIFTAMAGAMGGRRDFDRGTAVLALAAIPAYVGNALGTFPWIGWLIAIVLSIYGLICLYRFLPDFLEVPDSKRVLHFVVSLVLTVIASFVIASGLGVGAYVESTTARIEPGGRSEDAASSRGGGFLGEVQRNAEIYDAAMADTYSPPDNGRLKRQQVEEYLRVMTRAKAMQDDYAARMESLSKEIENKEDASFSDLMKIYQGVGGAISIGNAAMDIVKTGGGNWAEHIWVEEQLRVARYQPDANDAAAHNRELYDEFATQLDGVAPF
jgi:hypothetical protein